MSVNESRNLNYDLQEGLSDGKSIKPSPDRGGETEPQSQRMPRVDLYTGQVGNGTAGVETADHLYDGGLRKTGPRSHR